METKQMEVNRTRKKNNFFLQVIWFYSSSLVFVYSLRTKAT